MKEKKIVYTCNIAPELLEAWKKLKRKKDAQAICETFGYSRPTVDKALNYGQVDTPELKGQINKFFKDRALAEREEANELISLDQAQAAE